jgi:3-hydroxyacyl-CoA dehydrogenase
VPGFVLNRLQGALLAEAFRLVGEGYVSPQDLDHTVKNGSACAGPSWGPFETIELNAPGGIADYVARFGPSFLAPVAAEPRAQRSTTRTAWHASWPNGARRRCRGASRNAALGATRGWPRWWHTRGQTP